MKRNLFPKTFQWFFGRLNQFWMNCEFKWCALNGLTELRVFNSWKTSTNCVLEREKTGQQTFWKGKFGIKFIRDIYLFVCSRKFDVKKGEKQICLWIKIFVHWFFFCFILECIVYFCSLSLSSTTCWVNGVNVQNIHQIFNFFQAECSRIKLSR